MSTLSRNAPLRVTSGMSLSRDEFLAIEHLMREDRGKKRGVGKLFRAERSRQAATLAAEIAQKFASGQAVDVTGTPSMTGPHAPLNSGDAGPLLMGIRNEFIGTYMRRAIAADEFWNRLFFRPVPVSGSYYQYTFPETAPYPERHLRGQPPVSGSFRYIGNRLDVYAYAVRVHAHTDDVDDDQTGSVWANAQRAGANFGSLKERLAIQLLTGTTDLRLLPTIPLCADGAALFSETDGEGEDRFGVQGGNVIKIGTDPDANDIREFITKHLPATFRRFKDTEKEPLFDPNEINAGVALVHGPELEEEMRKALNQRRIFEAVDAGTSNAAAAAPSNIVIDSQMKVETFNTQRIEDKSIYAILVSPQIERPGIWGDRRPLYEVPATEQVSDTVRDTLEAYLQFRCRVLAGYHLPYQIIEGRPEAA